MPKYIFDDEDNAPMNDEAYDLIREKERKNKNGLREQEMQVLDVVRGEEPGSKKS